MNRGQLPQHPMVAACKGGERAWVARKILAHRGHRDMEPLEGNMKHWKSAGLPLEKSPRD